MSGLTGQPLWRFRVALWPLRLYPDWFRAVYECEMRAVLKDSIDEGRDRGWLFSLRTFCNLLLHAVLIRRGSGVKPPNRGPRRLKGNLGSRLRQDLLLALRHMRRRPAFTLLAVAMLSLGLGSSLAVFRFTNALVMSPGFGSDEALVRLYGAAPQGSRFDSVPYPSLKDIQERNRVFTGVAAHREVISDVGDKDNPLSARGELVSGDYFAVLEAGPSLGRVLMPEDDQVEGERPVVVISNPFWRRVYGSDPGVLGRTLEINGSPFQVVGVTRDGFSGTFPAFKSDFWVPIAMHRAVRGTRGSRDRRGWGWLHLTARLSPEETIESARRDMGRVVHELLADYPKTDVPAGFTVTSAGALPDGMRSDFGDILKFSLWVSGLVLLVVCTNIAAVLLARVSQHEREIGIRRSMGSTRVGILRQWLVESLTLCLAGGAGGLVVSSLVQGLLLSWLPAEDFLFAFSPTLETDYLVVGFVVTMVLLTSLLCGLLPAWKASRMSIAGVLREGGEHGAGGPRQSRLFAGFISVQAAVTVFLAVVAALLGQTLYRVRDFHPGFETENLSLVRIDARAVDATPEVRRGVLERFSREMTSNGLGESSFAMNVPLGKGSDRQGFQVPGQEPPDGRSYFSFDINVVGPAYFRTMSIPLLAGRGFENGDVGKVVINETLAEMFWSEFGPLGETLLLAEGDPLEIVGVAADIKYYSPKEVPRPYVYLPLASADVGVLALHYRSRGDLEAEGREIRRVVREIDPRIRVGAPLTLARLRESDLLVPKALASTSGVFSLVALVLTSIGLFGVVSQAVVSRMRELGIRMAMGAGRKDIRRLVLRRGVTFAGMGIVIGLALSFAATSWLETWLFGVSSSDPLTFGAVGLGVLLTTLLASLLPAVRAAAVDPVEVLRAD